MTTKSLVKRLLLRMKTCVGSFYSTVNLLIRAHPTSLRSIDMMLKCVSLILVLLGKF
jgi:hypothetical protein